MECTAVKEKAKYVILYRFGSLRKFARVSGCSYTTIMGVLNGYRSGSVAFWGKFCSICNIDEKDMPEMMSDGKFEEDLTSEEKMKLSKRLFKHGMCAEEIKVLLDMSTEDLDKVFKVSR